MPQQSSYVKADVVQVGVVVEEHYLIMQRSYKSEVSVGSQHTPGPQQNVRNFKRFRKVRNVLIVNFSVIRTRTKLADFTVAGPRGLEHPTV